MPTASSYRAGSTATVKYGRRETTFLQPLIQAAKTAWVQRHMDFSPSVKTCGFDCSLQQSRKAANLMVCRSAFSRLPTAQSKIEAWHRCLQPATSRYESYGFRHRAAETLLKVEIPRWDFKSALPTADGKIKDFAAAPQGLRCVPSGGVRK